MVSENIQSSELYVLPIALGMLLAGMKSRKLFEYIALETKYENVDLKSS